MAKLNTCLHCKFPWENQCRKDICIYSQFRAVEKRAGTDLQTVIHATVKIWMRNIQTVLRTFAFYQCLLRLCKMHAVCTAYRNESVTCSGHLEWLVISQTI